MKVNGDHTLRFVFSGRTLGLEYTGRVTNEEKTQGIFNLYCNFLSFGVLANLDHHSICSTVLCTILIGHFLYRSAKKD